MIIVFSIQLHIFALIAVLHYDSWMFSIYDNPSQYVAFTSHAIHVIHL